MSVSPAEARARTVEVAALIDQWAAEIGRIPVQIRRNRFRYGEPGTPRMWARRGEVVEVDLHDFIRGYADGEFELPVVDDVVHPADVLTTTQVHDMSVEEVLAYLAEHPDQRDRVLKLERAGRARGEILNADVVSDEELSVQEIVQRPAAGVIAYAQAHPERAEELLEAEEAGKDRKGVRDVLESLIG